MTKTKLPEPQRGLTFDDVWAALIETREAIKETSQQMKETDKRWEKHEKSLNKLEKVINENGRQIGGLHNSFGEFAEHLIGPNINKRFNELGYHFDTMSEGSFKILDDNQNVKAEVDVLLNNDEFTIAVEIKSRPVLDDIKHHMKRLEIIKKQWIKDKNHRKIHGAIAAAVFPLKVKEAAIKEGLYVLELYGDKMRIAMPEGFKPKEW